MEQGKETDGNGVENIRRTMGIGMGVEEGGGVGRGGRVEVKGEREREGGGGSYSPRHFWCPDYLSPGPCLS